MKEVQSAQDGVQQMIAWSTSWDKDLRLVDICRSMCDTKVLDQLLLYQSLQGRGDEQHVLGRLVFTFGAELLSHRLWSMARYDTCCWFALSRSGHLCRHNAVDEAGLENSLSC